MYKLIINEAGTGKTLLASVSNNNEEDYMKYAQNWMRENELSPDRVIVNITSLKDENKQHSNEGHGWE